MAELTAVVNAFLDHVVSQIQRRRGADAEEGTGASAVKPLAPAVRHWFEEAEAAATILERL